jgi:hypothetical protein
VTWEGAYDRHFRVAAFIGISYIAILYGLLYVVGANNFVWCLLAAISLIGLVPIMVSLTQTEYQDTLQALLQRIWILTPDEQRFLSIVYICITIIAILACAVLGYQMAGSDGATFAFSLSLLLVSIMSIIILTTYSQATMIVYSQGLPPPPPAHAQGGSGPATAVAIDPTTSARSSRPGMLGGGPVSSGGRRLAAPMVPTVRRVGPSMSGPSLAPTRAVHAIQSQIPSAQQGTTRARVLDWMQRQPPSRGSGRPPAFADLVSGAPVEDHHFGGRGERLANGQPSAEWLQHYEEGHPVPFDTSES